MSDPKAHTGLDQRLAAAIERWALPDVAGPVVGRMRNDRRSAAAEQSRAALEASGYQAGLARAQAEMQSHLDALARQTRQLESILQLLGQPLQQLDGEVEKQLLALALAVGKQLARRELRLDPAQVIGIIRESLGQLPAAARDIRVHLHPDDANTVRERLTAPSNERAWVIVEDPTMSRGGCVVRTETSQIDARLESRISAVVASALGEERTPQRQATPDAGNAE